MEMGVGYLEQYLACFIMSLVTIMTVYNRSIDRKIYYIHDRGKCVCCSSKQGYRVNITMLSMKNPHYIQHNKIAEQNILH